MPHRSNSRSTPQDREDIVTGEKDEHDDANNYSSSIGRSPVPPSLWYRSTCTTTGTTPMSPPPQLPPPQQPEDDEEHTSAPLKEVLEEFEFDDVFDADEADLEEIASLPQSLITSIALSPILHHHQHQHQQLLHQQHPLVEREDQAEEASSLETGCESISFHTGIAIAIAGGSTSNSSNSRCSTGTATMTGINGPVGKKDNLPPPTTTTSRSTVPGITQDDSPPQEQLRKARKSDPQASDSSKVLEQQWHQYYNSQKKSGSAYSSSSSAFSNNNNSSSSISPAMPPRQSTHRLPLTSLLTDVTGQQVAQSIDSARPRAGLGGGVPTRSGSKSPRRSAATAATAAVAVAVADVAEGTAHRSVAVSSTSAMVGVAAGVTGATTIIGAAASDRRVVVPPLLGGVFWDSSSKKTMTEKKDKEEEEEGDDDGAEKSVSSTAGGAASISRNSKAKFTDLEILRFLPKLINSFNCGNLEKVNRIVDKYFNVRFRLRSTFSARDVVGRSHLKEVYAAILEDSPDTVYTIKYSKLLRDKSTQEKYLAVKLHFTQTRCLYTNKGEKLNKVLKKNRDNSEVLKTLKADLDIDGRQRYFEDKGLPYTAEGYEWYRYSLSIRKNEITECSFTRKFISVELFSLSSLSDDEDI